MAKTYTDMEQRWAKTKPIRGRSVDVRPIGERRRDWEQIVRHPIDESMWSYAARLYNTDVVTYLPNGDIIINTNGWHTPSTAEFIHIHSPFMCIKRHNKLWVHARASMEHPRESMKAYPLGDTPMRFNWKGGWLYEPAEKVMIQKKVINRVLAKEAREPLMPFLKWTKTLLALSDGWVMHETMKEALGWEQREDGGPMHFPLESRDERQMYKLLTEQADIEPEHVYLRVLCSLARRNYIQDRTVYRHMWEQTWSDGRGRSYHQTFCDYQIEFETIKRKVYAWVEKFENVHQIIEVEPGTDSIRGVV